MSTTEPGAEARPEIHRGLNGVYFDRSQVCSIDGRAGTLHYRGYSIHELAERSTFEETAYLLLCGEMPTRDELDGFESELRAARTVPDPVLEIPRAMEHAHPMDVLRTAVSAIAAFDPERNDVSPEAVARKGARVTSQAATLVAAHHAIREGREPIAPSESLSHAANFLYMMTGEEPAPETARLMDVDFVLHAEHSSNASSFAARVVASTGADVHSAIVSGIAALSGPAHGGAAENVMQMAREIGDPANAAQYVKAKRSRREPVMGFGHRVYRTEDPRARHLRDGVRRLSAERGEPTWFAILEAVEEAMRPYARLGVAPNVDFYAGVIYHLLGIPQEFFVPIFALGRVPGWTVQVLEQIENNILIRPLLDYTGPAARPYIPIEKRG